MSCTLKTLAAPTNLSGTTAAGGSLAASTTYYYKVYAIRADPGGAVTVSPRSDTFSIATDNTNKTINLTWDAIPGYTPSSSSVYALLRNTSDVFTDDLAVGMMQTTNNYTYPAITTNSFSDTNANQFGKVCNFIGGLPTIYVYGGTSGTYLRMKDIYAFCLTDAPGRVIPAVNTDFMEYSSWKQYGMSWIINANIIIGHDGTNNQTTYFAKYYTGVLMVYGSFRTTTTATVQFGTKDNTKTANISNAPVLIHNGQSRTTYWHASDFAGVTKAYGLRLQRSRVWSNDYCSWGDSYFVPGLSMKSGSEILDCNFTYGGNGYIITTSDGSTPSVERCFFHDVRCPNTLTLNEPVVTGGDAIGLRYYGNVTVNAPKSLFNSYDITWHTGLVNTIIDGLFQSHNQADNRPWLFLGYTNLSMAGSLTFKQTVKGVIKNREGNAIQGALVVITDLDGATVYSGTTDANGDFDAGALTTRTLYGTQAIVGLSSVGAAHEDTHIANGKLSRVMKTPHTIVVSKAGYKNYQGSLYIDRKLDLEIALTPLPIGVPPEVWGTRGI